MPEHHHYDDDAIVNVETHHEKSDVNIRALFWFVVIFIIFAAVTHALLYLLYRGYVHIGNSAHFQGAKLSEIEKPAGANVPPVPRLQPLPSKDDKNHDVPPYRNTPVTDMADLRAHEEQVLQNTGWVDKEKGIVHIPIEDAERLALQRGFTVTVDPNAAPPAAATPVVPNAQTPHPDTNATAIPAATGTAADIRPHRPGDNSVATTTNPNVLHPNEPVHP